MRLLALETSCDDTCAAVTDEGAVLSSVVSSQARFHQEYGGVVPEVASRHHLQLVNAVIEAASVSWAAGVSAKSGFSAKGVVLRKARVRKSISTSPEG